MMPPLNRREILRLGAAGVGSLAMGSQGLADQDLPSEHSFHYDHVLGTSFDAWIVSASALDAERAGQRALTEIERLRTIFSLYDSESELSKLNRSGVSVAASDELLAVLTAYDHWNALSSGACNPGIGGMTRLWETAARLGTLPDPRALESAARRITTRLYAINGRQVSLLTDQPLNLNSIAKGYVLQQVAATVRANVPGVSAGLLNLGGDMIAWGETHWPLGIQNPDSPAENATPLTRVNLREASIATSGGYLRHHAIGGVRHSHILDPRTGRTAVGVASATVIAPDSVTANVLATTLCVLGIHDGLKLAERLGQTECLLIDDDGEQHRTRGFGKYELPGAAEQTEPEKKDQKTPEKKVERNAADWPEDYEVRMNLELPVPVGGRARRPYVAVWIEDAEGKAVRTVSVWGNSPRWINTLSGWWKIGKQNNALVKAVSRATRSPGKYTVVWDGKDDDGKSLPQGTYTVKIEVHREHGKDVTQTGKLECLGKPAEIKLAKNAETEETMVSYAKKEKKDKK